MIKTRSVINCKIAYNKIAIYLFLSVVLIKFAHKNPTFENDEMGLLLKALMTDGYLVRDNEQYKFRSPLLRDYWKETYC